DDPRNRGGAGLRPPARRADRCCRAWASGRDLDTVPRARHAGRIARLRGLSHHPLVRGHVPRLRSGGAIPPAGGRARPEAALPRGIGARRFRDTQDARFLGRSQSLGRGAGRSSHGLVLHQRLEIPAIPPFRFPNVGSDRPARAGHRALGRPVAEAVPSHGPHAFLHLPAPHLRRPRCRDGGGSRARCVPIFLFELPRRPKSARDVRLGRGARMGVPDLGPDRGDPVPGIEVVCRREGSQSKPLASVSL
ncbi:MAG: hypothetical protein AVDCRST_MAG93-3033, partial [uncultured Chloroflexia bacterium]